MKELHLSYQDLQMMPMEYIEWFQDRQIQYIVDENKKLEQLRDTLLPKLMNGEIDLDKMEI